MPDYINNEEFFEEICRCKANFDPDNPGAAMSPRLSEMFITLVEQIGKKKNWYWYSYLSEMKGEALIILVRTWHKFDPERTHNPFGYFTTTVERAFLTYMEKEKKQVRVGQEITKLESANMLATGQVSKTTIDAIKDMTGESKHISTQLDQDLDGTKTIKSDGRILRGNKARGRRLAKLRARS
ncbi:hypothetical protein V5T82_07190 [Magnetovibrio sp. PR-2]|uniref:hypothetical protein n=1 Tax=Magnetovibrio sp. PR-2 TaxID=3120356 RepID=UPI002FCDE274